MLIYLGGFVLQFDKNKHVNHIIPFRMEAYYDQETVQSCEHHRLHHINDCIRIPFHFFYDRSHNRTTGINIFVQIIVTAALIVSSTIFFMIRRDTRLYSIILMASSAVAYVVIAMFNRTEYTFLYGFILIYIAMVYCNLRITHCSYSG